MGNWVSSGTGEDECESIPHVLFALITPKWIGTANEKRTAKSDGLCMIARNNSNYAVNRKTLKYASLRVATVQVELKSESNYDAGVVRGKRNEEMCTKDDECICY